MAGYLIIWAYMKKIFLFLTLLFSAYINSQENNLTISGKIIDSDFNTPLEYATISIYDSKKQNLINGVISDNSGFFSIELTKGLYDLKIEYISFETKTLEKIDVQNSIDLGIISLSINENLLDEIEVIGEKTEIEIKLDKTVYNIGKDLTLKGSSVSDVLDNLPSLEVDIDGNVSLRGNQSVRILINGKPSGLVGISSNDALKQFPSESVEKVEVITSPSARYNAEGTAGIINIVLRKNKLAGLNGSASLNLGDPRRVGISTNLNFRTKKISLFGNIGDNSTKYINGFKNETEYFTAREKNNFLNENGERNSERNSNYYNGGIEYFFNEKTSFVASFVNSSSDGLTNTSNLIDQTFDNINSLSERLEDENEIDENKEFSFNFSKKFNDKGHELTIDYQKEKSFEIESSSILNSKLKPIYERYLSEKITTDENQNSELYKIDYVLPIGEEGQFEAGFRRSNQHQKIDYLVEKEDNLGNYISDNNLSNTLLYNEKVNAYYTQYGNKKNNFSFLLGLRFEESITNVTQVVNGDNTKKKYNDLFPTLNLALELKEDETITLGYNRRIRRARSYFINPFPSRSSITNIFQGNPNIEPTYSNGIDLGYLKRFSQTTINGSIYFRKSTGEFTFITESTGESVLVNGNLVPVIRRTPINLASNSQTGVEFNVNYTQSKLWRVRGNINFFESDLKGEYNGVVYDSKNFSWSGGLNNYLKIFSSVDWQTSLSYRAPQKTAVSNRKARISSNTALSKDLMKDKLTLTFKVNDIFETQKWRIESFNENYRSYSESSWRGGRNFELNLIYRFNQKKSDRKRSNNYENYGEGGFGA
jgi:hypothetical protein